MTLRKSIIVSIASFLALVIPSVAGAQCSNGQCASAAYGYYPAAVYFVAPQAYLTPPAPFRQYGGSGRIYESWGDAGQLTAWIAANDPARPPATADRNPPAPVATPVPSPVAEPVPSPTPTPALPMIKVKVHIGRYELSRVMQMLKDVGLTNVSQTYEVGYPIYGEIEASKLNALRSLPGVIRIEVVK